MTKPRGPLDYLSDDWGMKPPGGTNASGVDETPDYEQNIQGRAAMPEHPEWGLGPKGRNDFGHSEAVEETKGARWDMDRDEVAQGFDRPGSGNAGDPGTASYPQSIPQTNEWDRTGPYAKEHHETGAYDGEGHDKGPGPGETIESSKLVG
jgi:hypothetical protein